MSVPKHVEAAYERLHTLLAEPDHTLFDHKVQIKHHDGSEFTTMHGSCHAIKVKIQGIKEEMPWWAIFTEHSDVVIFHQGDTAWVKVDGVLTFEDKET